MGQKLSCCHCKEEFGWHEYSTYIYQNDGSEMECIACNRKSDVVNNGNLGFYVSALIAFLFGIFTVLFMGIGVPSLLQADGGIYLSTWLLIAGFFAGFTAARILFRTLRWHMSSLKQPIKSR